MFRPTLALAKAAKSKAKAKAKAKAVAIAALDERRVFEVLRPALIGNKADATRAKRFINKDIQLAAKDSKEVADLVRAHSLAIVSSAARTLLRKSVFASTDTARAYFPGIQIEDEPVDVSYTPPPPSGSPAQLTAPAGTEPADEHYPEELDPDEVLNKEAKSEEDEANEAEDSDELREVEAINPRDAEKSKKNKDLREAAKSKETKETQEAKETSDAPETPSDEDPPLPEILHSPGALAWEKSPKSDIYNVPDPQETDRSPFSLYVPFVAQHYLLTQIQRILERACLEFAQRALPDVLQRNHWDCVEAIELDIFVRALLVPRNMLMLRQAEKNRPTTDTPQDKSLWELLRSVSVIRHLTVHRRRMTLNNVEQVLTDAHRFTRVLAQSGPHSYKNVNSDPSVKRMTMLRKSAQSSFRQLRSDKVLMDARLVAIRTHLGNERSRINREETALIGGLVTEYARCQEHMTGKLYWSLWHGRSLAAWMRLTWLSWRKYWRTAYLWRT